jgi:hypothetical protein
MEHQSPFVGGGPCARTTFGKADATTPVNGYEERSTFADHRLPVDVRSRPREARQPTLVS